MIARLVINAITVQDLSVNLRVFGELEVIPPFDARERSASFDGIVRSHFLDVMLDPPLLRSPCGAHFSVAHSPPLHHKRHNFLHCFSHQ